MEQIERTEKPVIELKSRSSDPTAAGITGARIWLAIILAFAIVVRLTFFVGYVGADPQEGNLYILTIKSMADGNYSLAPIKAVMSQKNVDPAYFFQLRMSFLVPEQILVRYFGPSDFSFILFPFMCSLGGVLLAYLFMSRLAGNKTLGLIAAFLLSVYPIDCIFATKVSVDVPLGFLIALTVYFFLNAELRNGDKGSSHSVSVSYFLCGMFFSAANGIKSFGIVLPIFFLLYFMAFRKFNWRQLFIVIGFLPISAALSYYFYVNSGDPFLMNTSMRAMQLFNFLDPSRYSMFNLWGIKVLNTYGGPFSHTLWAFTFKQYLDAAVYFLTIYYHLFVIGGAIWYFSFRKTYSPEKNKVFISMLLWVVGGFLFLEFFTSSLRDLFLNHTYYMLPKQPRFHLYLSVPVACIGSFLFYSLRKQKHVMYIGLVFVAVMSFYSMNLIKAHYTDGVREMVDTAKYIREHPDKTYYTDYLAVNQLRYRLHYNPNIRIKNVSGLKSVEDIGDGVLIVGGARSVDVSSEFVFKIIPEWVKDAFLDSNNNSLVCIKQFEYKLSPRRPYRKNNLKMLTPRKFTESR